MKATKELHDRLENCDIEPLGNRCLVEPVEAPDMTSGGIIVPDTNKEKPMRGRVLAVGDGCTTVKVGHVVLYGKFAGVEILMDDEKCLIVVEEDILAVLTQKGE